MQLQYFFFNSVKLLTSRLPSMWLLLKMAEQLEWYVLFEPFSIEFPGLKMWKPKRNVFFFTWPQSGLCGDISELCIGLLVGVGALNTKFDKRFDGIPAFLQEEGHYLGTEGRALRTVTQLHRCLSIPISRTLLPRGERLTSRTFTDATIPFSLWWALLLSKALQHQALDWCLKGERKRHLYAGNIELPRHGDRGPKVISSRLIPSSLAWDQGFWRRAFCSIRKSNKAASAMGSLRDIGQFSSIHPSIHSCIHLFIYPCIYPSLCTFH